MEVLEIQLRNSLRIVNFGNFTTRYPRFKSSHRQFLFPVNRKKIKKNSKGQQADNALSKIELNDYYLMQ